MIDPEDSFGDDDPPTPPEPKRTSRPRTVSARRRERTVDVAAALGGRRNAARPQLEPPADPEPTPEALELQALGDPPADGLEAQAWLHRAMVLSARQAIKDPKISEADRRKELRAFAKVAVVLLPDVRRWEAERAVLEERAQMDTGRRRGPELEAIPADVEADGES